jgi:hypothetical protein
VFVEHQEQQKRKINELKSRARTEWVAVLATSIISVLLIGCTSVTACHSPVISALTAESEVVRPSQTCEITCVASDSDDDSLNYQWSANRGSISGEGPVVNWIAPEAVGTYTITVSVNDGNGSQTTRYLSIEVAQNHPPTIESLDVEEADVIVSTNCHIECVASDQDGDELSYEWSANGGSISGEGSIVTWAAPEAVGTYTIMATVTDGQGAEDTASLDIDVLSVNNSPKIKDFLVTNEIDKPMEEGKVLKEHCYYIECIASDPDGDKLSYDWWVSDGKILEEERSRILWQAPNEGTKVTFEVTASDERGGKDDDDMVLKVVTTTCQLYS